MPADDEMVVLNCRVPAKLLLALDAVAESQDRSRASVVRRTLEAALERGGAAVSPSSPSEALSGSQGQTNPEAQPGVSAPPRAPRLMDRTEKTPEQLDQEYADRMAER